MNRVGAPPTKIMRKWRILADGGHAWAQSQLDFWYHYGERVTTDAVASAEWYAKAADQGLANAQINQPWSFP